MGLTQTILSIFISSSDPDSSKIYSNLFLLYLVPL